MGFDTSIFFLITLKISSFGFYTSDSLMGNGATDYHVTLSLGGQVEIRAFNNFSINGFPEYRTSYKGKLAGQ